MWQFASAVAMSQVLLFLLLPSPFQLLPKGFSKFPIFDLSFLSLHSFFLLARWSEPSDRGSSILKVSISADFCIFMWKKRERNLN